MISVNFHSSIKITGNKIVYFDPLKVMENHDADYIFITHSHWDHFSKEDILKIKKDNTKIIGPKDMNNSFIELGFVKENIILFSSKEKWHDEDISIKTVPSYNINKNFHPKENGWLGYIVTIDNTIYYVPGDTDVLKENEAIICDILFVPIGGTYTMDAMEAANFTNKLRPKKVVPVHYGSIVGSNEDYYIFESNVDSNIRIENYINVS